MKPLQIGIIVALVIMVILVLVVFIVMRRSAAASIPPAIPQYGAPVQGAPAYIPPPSSGAPPSPVYVDPYGGSQLPTVSPPLPTGTQPSLPPQQPPVYTAPAPPPPKPQPSQKPVLYRGSNLLGDAWEVPGIGKWAVANARVRNEASSIRVPTGWKLTAYDKDDCTGTMKIFTTDVMDLGGTGLNNDIACVDLQLA